jgi:hypothetical protein
MPITLNCACGKVLRIADEHAGKRVKCPACSAIISSAPPQPAFEVVEDEPKQLATARPAAKPRDDEDEDSYGLKSAEKSTDTPKKKPNFRKRADDDDDDDEEESRPRKKKRQTSRSAGARGGTDAGKRIGYIVSGGFMIPIGIGLAMWGNSGEGRGATKLLIFGICLAIGGLITLVRGITGNIPDDE